MPLTDRILSKRALSETISLTYKLIVPSKIPSCDCTEIARIFMLKSAVITFVKSRIIPGTFYSYRAGRMENEQVAMIVNRFGGSGI